MEHIKIKRIQHLEELVLFEDEDIVLVNKPLHMASLDDKSAMNLNALAKEYNPELSLCHRLDKNTSGILLMAKGAENYKKIALQFQQREVKKVYLTIVAGLHQYEGEKIDLPLYISSNKKVTVNKKQGKPSQTIIYTEEQFRDYTVLRCEPITGRMHQIRAHLAAIGSPIVGDALYRGIDIYLSGMKRKYKQSGRKEEQAINHGYLLHAQSLTFNHPTSGEEINITAPLPKNFKVVLKILRKYNS